MTKHFEESHLRALRFVSEQTTSFRVDVSSPDWRWYKELWIEGCLDGLRLPDRRNAIVMIEIDGLTQHGRHILEELENEPNMADKHEIEGWRAAYQDLPDEELISVRHQMVSYSPQHIAATQILHTRQQKEHAKQKAQQQMETQSNNATPKIFISHSSKDIGVAKALIDLLRLAVGLTHREIRCTSVDGYRLEVGADTDAELKKELKASKVFIGLITPSSIESAYVLFELGARWGADLHLAPVLACGADSNSLRGPLAKLNALNAAVEAQMHQLVHDIASKLGQPAPNAAVYEKEIEELTLRASQNTRPEITQMAPSSEGILSLVDRSFEPRQTTLTFKRKIRVVLRNDTGQEIQVDTPDWAADAKDLVIQPSAHHLGATSKIRLENKQTGGWKKDKWLDETNRITVPPAYHFEVWVGLSHEYTDNALQQHVREKQIGTLLFFVVIDGQRRKVRIRVT